MNKNLLRLLDEFYKNACKESLTENWVEEFL